MSGGDDAAGQGLSPVANRCDDTGSIRPQRWAWLYPVRVDGRAETAPNPELDREWWLRVPLVLTSPRHAFAALRDDSPEAASARAEPVLAIMLLAGIAGVLSADVSGRLFDDPEFDGLLVAVWAFLAGGLYGFAGLLLVGGLLHVGARIAGSEGTYRRSRHLLAFAAVPLALSLVLWPVRLALYGGDLLRRGGDDTGAGNAVFEAFEAGFLVWACALVVVGVRTVHGWSWARTFAASAPVLALCSLVLVEAYDVVG